MRETETALVKTQAAAAANNRGVHQSALDLVMSGSFYHIDPTVLALNLNMADYGGVGSELIFVQLVGGFKPGTTLADNAKNSIIIYNGVTYYVDNGMMLPLLPSNTALTIINQDTPLADNSDPNGDYGLNLIAVAPGTTASYSVPLDVGQTGPGAFNIANASLGVTWGTIENNSTLSVSASAHLALQDSLVVGQTTSGRLSINTDSALVVGDDITVGGGGGTGTLALVGGSSITTTGMDADIIGGWASGIGTATLDGAGTVWNSTHSLFVGAGGTGTLTLTGSAAVAVADFTVGAGTGSTGTLMMSGGSTITTTGTNNDNVGGWGGAVAAVTLDGAGTNWTSTHEIDIGQESSGHLVVQNAAKVDTATNMDIGWHGSGTLSILSGGTVTNSGTSTNIGDAAGFGYATIDGQASLWRTSGWLNIGYSSNRTLEISGGTGNGTLEIINGGVMNAGTGAAIGNAGGTGEVVVSGANSTFLVNAWLGVGTDTSGSLTIENAGTVQIDPSGSVLQTEGYAQIAQSAGAAGSTLIITGAGSELVDNGALGVGWGAAGELDIQDGGLANFVTAQGAIYDSLIAGGTQGGIGIVRVDAGTIESGGNDVMIGYQSAGSLDITNTGLVNASGGFLVALKPGSTGTVSVDGVGSALNVGRYFVIGGGTAAGGVGIVQISRGAALSSTTSVFMYPGAALSLDSTGTVEIGNSLDATAGTIAIDSSFTLSGAGMVGGPVALHGTMEATGGTLDIQGGVTGTGTLQIDGGAALFLDSPVVGVGIDFLTSASSTLKLASAQLGGGLISGFAGSAEILVVNAVGATSHISRAGGVTTLELSEAGDPVGNLTFTGTPTLYFDPANGAVTACFAAGTRIATTHGDVAVERLTAGDLILPGRRGGVPRPVVWTGYRHVDCRRHPKPLDVWPVRVHAGAFGPGKPSCDLLLSPDHAVFTGGVLIPVRYLINGATIVQEPAASVTYWHVELPRHGVLLAEGLPCESYLDTGNRSAFANGGPALQIHPDFALQVWAGQSCAPLVRSGTKLDAARRACLRQAKRLGHVLSSDPVLQLYGDTRALVADICCNLWRVTLLGSSASVRLSSRTWVPAQTGMGEHDTRQLGVALARLWLDGRQASLDSPALCAGWHAPEGDWRWTSGEGVLETAGVRELTFELALAGAYWQGAPHTPTETAGLQQIV